MTQITTGYGFQPVKRCTEVLGLKPHWFRDRRLQGQFIEGVHYRRIPGIRSYAYHIEICQDFMQTGGDLALHQPAIERFLAARQPATSKHRTARRLG